MPVKRQVITGPDIDKLVNGIHGPEIERLERVVYSQKVEGKRQRKEARAVKKQLAGALRHNETLLEQLAKVKERRAELEASNRLLRSQLLNLGITPAED